MRIAALYSKIADLASQGEHFAVVTVINKHGSTPRGVGAKMIILSDGTRFGTIGGDCLENDSADEAVRMLREDKLSYERKRSQSEAPAKALTMLLDEEEAGGVGMLCGGKVEMLIEIVRPELQLIVLGSGPIATGLLRLADFLDISSMLIDPIPPRDGLPPLSTFLKERHEEGLQKLQVGQNAAIVIVTRHKNDVPSLKAALSTRAGYIGMIGSKHRVQTIFNRVAKELGLELGAFASRVHAPIGLDIGAHTPTEIALSVLAEILAHFRKGTVQSKALYKDELNPRPMVSLQN